jgi:hypothetical protein
MRHHQESRSLLSQRERDQPEGARRGGKEAAEVARADRDEGASEAQAAEEDLARQVETLHACPPALRARSHARRQAPEDAPTRAQGGRREVSQVAIERRKTVRVAARSGAADGRSSTKRRRFFSPVRELKVFPGQEEVQRFVD